MPLLFGLLAPNSRIVSVPRPTELSTRLATQADAAAIAAIYNEGIADRIATFETEPRTAEQIATQLAEKAERYPTVVVERDGQVVAWASAGPYRRRPGCPRRALSRVRGARLLEDSLTHLPRERRQPRVARALRIPRGRRLSSTRQAGRGVARLRDRREAARRSAISPDLTVTLNRGVIAMCAAQACAQIGAFSVAALLPTLIPAWSLTNTEAGWISGIYYAAYTLAVPVLSSLADRVDPKRIYLASVALTAIAFVGFAWVATGFWAALGFRALMGAGWAGSYMPGLKALSDVAEGQQQSRAVAAHAAAVGVSGALSFGVAGAVNAWLGWQWALVPGALGAALAFVVVLVGLPGPTLRAAPGPRSALLDFRPILRNRSALAYSIAYCVHTWEMSALRGWVVAFLTFVAAQESGAWIPLAPAIVASVMGLVGVWASIWGNELAIRFGRRRFILGAMFTSAALAAVIGFSAALPYAGAAALVLLYAMLIWSDSSSLTAGSAGSAALGQRGATLAVHSTLGYAGGFLGPLVLGATLDLSGGASVLGWGLAFGHVTIALLLGALVFVWLRPADLAGDRSRSLAAAPTVGS